MPRWRWKWCNKRGVGRPRSPLFLNFKPKIKEFSPPYSHGTVYITLPELEAFRLVDLEGFTQEEAGKKMGVSRGTVWRLLESCRKKVADALVNGKAIVIAEEEI